MGATHDSNIAINVSLDAAPAQVQGFSVVLGIALLSGSSLNGADEVEYTDTTDAIADNTAGYLSDGMLDAVTTMFSQSPKPASVKVCAIDDSVASPAVKAFGSHAGAFDTVIEAHTGGVDGNNYRLVLVPDAATIVTIDVVGYVVIAHFKAATSTIADVETAITALSGANNVVDVKTGGTGATILAGVDAVEIVLAGGVDAVLTETYAEALARIMLIDDQFYGVFIESRATADILALSAAIEATSKVCAVQVSHADFLTGSYPAGFTALQTRERTLIAWHDTATEWLDAGWLANRLVYDPDTQSASWDAPVAGVAAYATPITAAQRTFGIANFVNLGLPYGGESFFVDAGVNAKGRPVYEIETADWYATRLGEDTAALKVAHSARGVKLTIDPVGQSKVKALVDARGNQGLRGPSPHFLDFDSQALTITPSDTAAQRFRFAAQFTDAVSGRLITYNLNFSRDALVRA